MRKQSRVSFFCTALITTAFILCSANATASAYGEGYDDGYEDGYDDAMEDCPCPRIKPLYTGFYLGAEGGYENYQVVSKGMEFGNFNYNHSAPGWVGDVFIGYGKSLPRNFYLGGEVFVGGSSASGTSSFSTSGDTIKSTYSAGTSYGFTFKPGYQLSSSLLHLNLGYARTEFTNKESITGGFDASASTSQWASGFKYGLGFETPICKSVSLRLDYNHIDYGTYTDSTTDTKISPSDNQGTFGFVYRPTF